MSVNLSYSRLDAYVQCAFKYWLTYEEGHYTSGGSIATEVGTLTHETLEEIAKCLRDGVEIDYQKLKDNYYDKLESFKFKYPDAFFEKDKSGRTYYDKAFEFTETTIYDLEKFMKAHPTYKIVGIEDEFNFNFKGDYNFKGFIDRFFYDEATGEYIVQDIKTYNQPVEDDKLKTPLQFVIYSLAVNQKYNCGFDKIKCQYYLPFCDITQDAGTKGYIDRGIKKINDILDKIESKIWDPHPTALCHWCPFCATNPDQPEEGKGLCCYYSLWTRENRTNDTASIWLGMENHPVMLENYNKQYKKEGGEK